MSHTYAEGVEDLINVNIGLKLGFDAMIPVPLQIDLALNGTFGLGPMALDFQARLDAALSLTVIAPDVWVTGQLQAMANLAAGIMGGIYLPGLALNANASLAADLQFKLLGINALIDATLAVKFPVIHAVNEIDAAAHAQVGYLAWSGTQSEFMGEAMTKMKQLAYDNGQGADVFVIAMLFSTEVAFNAAASMFLMV